MTTMRVFLAKPFVSHLWPSIHHVSPINSFTFLSPCVSLYDWEWILIHTAIHKCTAPPPEPISFNACIHAGTHPCMLHACTGILFQKSYFRYSIPSHLKEQTQYICGNFHWKLKYLYSYFPWERMAFRRLVSCHKNSAVLNSHLLGTLYGQPLSFI